MLIEDFLPLLSGVRKSGDHFTALCPAHTDKRASLSIKSGERWLLTKCYAGCTTAEICEALGLKVTDLALEKPRHLTGTFKDADLDTASMFVDLASRHQPLTVTDRAKLVAATAKRLRGTGGGS